MLYRTKWECRYEYQRCIHNLKGFSHYGVDITLRLGWGNAINHSLTKKKRLRDFNDNCSVKKSSSIKSLLIVYQLEFSGFWTKSTKNDVICKHLSKNRRIPVTYYALECSGIWTKTLRARLFCCPKPEEFQLYIRNWNSTDLGQQISFNICWVLWCCPKPGEFQLIKINWDSTVLGQKQIFGPWL